MWPGYFRYFSSILHLGYCVEEDLEPEEDLIEKPEEDLEPHTGENLQHIKF